MRKYIIHANIIELILLLKSLLCSLLTILTVTATKLTGGLVQLLTFFINLDLTRVGPGRDIINYKKMLTC